VLDVFLPSLMRPNAAMRPFLFNSVPKTPLTHPINVSIKEQALRVFSLSTPSRLVAPHHGALPRAEQGPTSRALQNRSLLAHRFGPFTSLAHAVHIMSGSCASCCCYTPLPSGWPLAIGKCTDGVGPALENASAFDRLTKGLRSFNQLLMH
jgi:hypothetical protein